MPDRVSGSAGVASWGVSSLADPQPSRRGLSTPLVVLLQGVATIGAFAGVGALAGLVWFHVWTPPVGTVQSGQWFTDETGLRASFSGTGLYVVIAAAAGLVLGIVVALLLDRSELVALVCLCGGAVLAGWLMWKVGVHHSPPDPTVAAATAADGKKLPGHLHLNGRVPFVAFPLGGLVAFAGVLLAVPKRGRHGSSAKQSETFPAADDSSYGS